LRAFVLKDLIQGDTSGKAIFFDQIDSNNNSLKQELYDTLKSKFDELILMICSVSLLILFVFLFVFLCLFS
jgi:uncharacterized membrane protein YqhA